MNAKRYFHALRVANGYTVESLAKAAGVSATQLHRYASGLINFKPPYLERLAKALRVPVGELRKVPESYARTVAAIKASSMPRKNTNANYTARGARQ